MAEFKLNAEVRSRTGKGDSHRLRAQGKVPAVMYGRELAPVHLILNSRELEKILSTSHNNTVFSLVFADGKMPERKVLVRDKQLHPIAQTYRHIDFQVLEPNHKVRVSIPLHYTGEPIGKKTGAIFQVQLRSVEVECLPAHIPAHFEADVTALDAGDALHVSDLKIDTSKMRVLANAGTALCNMTIVKEEVEVVPVAAEGAVPAEGAAAAEGAAPAAAGAAGAAPAAAGAKAPAAGAKAPAAGAKAPAKA